jgi:protoheme ferro-lyase
MTTQQEIRNWLEKTREKKATHMIVVCDSFSHEDYPVYVTKKQDVREIFREYDGKNMQRVMEVYSFKKDLETQLNEPRAFHFD